MPQVKTQDFFNASELSIKDPDLRVALQRVGTGFDNALRKEIIAAGVGITGADYAVAETGSVVVVPRQGLSRLVSLVPPVHIAWSG